MAGLQRENRFTAGNPADVGYSAIADKAEASKGKIRRNLKSFKNLKKYGKKGGLKALTGLSDKQIERKATRAVLADHNVQQKKLRTNVNRKKYSKPLLQRAQQKINQGYDITKGVGINKGANYGRPGPDVDQIRNQKLRAATKHLVTVQRNRRVMSTNIYKGKGYDIQQGHTQGPTPAKRYQTGLRKMSSPTATLTRGRARGKVSTRGRR